MIKTATIALVTAGLLASQVVLSSESEARRRGGNGAAIIGLFGAFVGGAMALEGVKERRRYEEMRYRNYNNQRRRYDRERDYYSGSQDRGEDAPPPMRSLPPLPRTSY
jgi:hypothetical protein